MEPTHVDSLTDKEFDNYYDAVSSLRMTNEGKMRMLRRAFNAELVERDYYVNAPYPGDVYILKEVLGVWDWEHVVASSSIGRKHYRCLIRDDSGAVVRDVFGNAVVITRKFSSAQQQELRQWWHLLSDEVKDED